MKTWEITLLREQTTTVFVSCPDHWVTGDLWKNMQAQPLLNGLVNKPYTCWEDYEHLRVEGVILAPAGEKPDYTFPDEEKPLPPHPNQEMMEL
jgi:hypothetical protein